jgi:phosphoenolpyruvate carboxykinase (ATP)
VPEPTFSPCFAGPFLPQPPAVYARLLGEKLAQHRPGVWLVNTGWTGGSESEGGHRMPIRATRALLHAALSGRLDDVECRVDPVFGFGVPVAVPGVETSLLDPRSTWRDADAYDAKARELAGMFHANFAKFEHVEPEVAAGGPLV